MKCQGFPHLGSLALGVEESSKWWYSPPENYKGEQWAKYGSQLSWVNRCFERLGICG